MGGRRAVFGACLSLGVGIFVAILFAGTVGVAQEQDDGGGGDPNAPYQPLFGDLVIEGTDFLPGSTVTLSGDGFAPNAAVQVAVRSNASGDASTEDTGEADGEGSVEFEFALTEDFSAGNYTATISGPAIDGATVQLSGVMVVYALPAATATPVPVEPAAPAPTPTTQRADVASPTATPLPEITVRNDPPPTLGAVPTPGTGAGESAEAEAEAEVAGETQDRDVDDTASKPEGGTSEAAAPSPGDAEPAGGADDDEVAAPATNPSDGGGSGTSPWLAFVGVIAVLGGLGGLAAWRQQRHLRRSVGRHSH